MPACFAVAALLLAGLGMLDPSVDRAGAPFEYFSASTTRLPSFEEADTGGPHVLDAGLRITPEGHLACRRGRLAVYLGETCRPGPWRVKLWADGVLPIASFATAFDGVWLRASALAAPAEGLPGPVGYLRLSLAGTAATQVTRLTVAWIPDPGLPVPFPDPPDGQRFAFDGDCAVSGASVLYQFPDLLDAVRWATLDTAYQAEFTAADAAVLGDTPVLAVSYRVALQAGQRRSLTFRVPEGSFSPALARPALRRADFDELALRATTQWTRWLGEQPAIKVPEAAVAEAYGAGVVRLRGYGDVPLAQISPEAERALLGAALQRGLVAYRDGPDGVGLSLAMSARRARLEVRDDHPPQALALLYGVLLHKSAFHGFAEAVPAEWSRRERLDRWAPLWDPEVTAETVQLLRDMLVRADGDRLRLFGVVSPAWLGVGEGLLARGVPTPFGPVTTALTRTAAGLAVKLPTGLSPAPAVVCVRVPWGWRATGATVDGREVEIQGAWVEVPPGAQRLEIVGGAEGALDEVAYTAVLARYREEYRALAEGFRASGGALETWAPAAPLGLEERRRRFEANHGGGGGS